MLLGRPRTCVKPPAYAGGGKGVKKLSIWLTHRRVGERVRAIIAAVAAARWFVSNHGETVGCGAGFFCTGSGFTNIPDRFCGTSCSKDADCAAVAGRSCQLRDDAVTDLLEQACSQSDGPLPPGTDIQSNQQGQCTTGLAVNFTANGATTTVCTAICGGNGDCAAFTASDATHTAITSCQPVGGFQTPSGGSQSVNLCVKP